MRKDSNSSMPSTHLTLVPLTTHLTSVIQIPNSVESFCFVTYICVFKAMNYTLCTGSVQGDTSVVVLFVLCFGVEFLCCLNLMYIHSFS